jgi:hypothetical protein
VLKNPFQYRNHKNQMYIVLFISKIKNNSFCTLFLLYFTIFDINEVGPCNEFVPRGERIDLGATWQGCTRRRPTSSFHSIPNFLQ